MSRPDRSDPPQQHGGNRLEILERFGHPEVLDFSASINPLGHPEGLRERILERWEEVLHYPDVAASELRAAFARRYGLPEASVLAGNGSAELIDLLFRVLSPRRVLLCPPDFGLYEHVLAAGTAVDRVPRREASGFGPDFGALREAVRDGDVVILSNPANPSGHLADPNDLAQLRARCADVGAVLALDEAFIDFCPGASLIAGALADRGLVVLRSLTKFFGIPGLRLGFLVSSPEIVERIGSRQVPWSVNALAQVAGIYCLGQPDWEGRTFEAVRRERSFLTRELGRLDGFRPLPSEANYLLVELSSPAPAARDVYEGAAARGILVRHCGSFGLGERFVRVAVRTREENLALLRALEEIGGGAIRPSAAAASGT